MKWRAALSLLVTALLLATAGCGNSSRGAVQGQVTVNGAPLEEGEIAFVPADPNLGPTAGAAIQHGAYHIDAARGPLAGDYRVQIHAFRKTGRKVWDGMGDEKAPTGQKNFVEEIEAFIPAKYNAQTGLRTTIEAGKLNEFTVDVLTDKKP